MLKSGVKLTLNLYKSFGGNIMVQGKLLKQENGRYAIYYEFTSGDSLEVFINGKWESTSVESSKGEYYLTNGSPIDGALVRKKSLFD